MDAMREKSNIGLQWVSNVDWIVRLLCKYRVWLGSEKKCKILV